MPERDEHRAKLAALEAKLAEKRVQAAVKSHSEEHYSQAQLAWRMVVEMVSGLGIGFGIGYGLDYLFGTIPIFLMLFTFLGLAAGIKTMMQSAREVHKKQLAKAGHDEDEKNGD